QRAIEGSEVLEVQVVEIRKRVLGQEHPSTLTSMANLAFIYRSQGGIDTTIALMIQVASLSSVYSAKTI
ncbi:hypothetical protein BDD12DRAFT_748738, partial [Trichophaea hybrida]